MNVIMLSVFRSGDGPYLVRGLIGAPKLPGTMAQNDWPTADRLVAALQADGWLVSADSRKWRASETTIGLTHPGTPPRHAADVLKAALPARLESAPARRSLGSGYSLDPDGAAREHDARVQQITADLMEGLAAIAIDSRLSDQGKQENIAAARARAVDQLASETENALRTIQSDRADLETRSHAPSSPPADQAALLLYTRDALHSQWQGMNNLDIQKAWQAAITAGDAIAVRVYRDFAVGVMKTRPPWNTPGGEKLLTKQLGDLLALSDRSLKPPEQLAATDRLKAMDMARKQIEGVSKRGTAAIQGAKIDPHSGQVIDVQTAAARQLIRSAI